MANKYCEIPGGQKIKDTYSLITGGFASVDADVAALASSVGVVSTSLAPLVNPVTIPTFTINPVGPLEVGDTLTQVAFTWAIEHIANAASAKIVDASASQEVVSVSSENGSHTQTGLSITKSVTGNQSYQLQALDKNNKAINSVVRTIEWYYATYCGSSAATSLDATSVKTLATKALKSGKNGNYTCPAGNYKYIAYPKSWGTSTFKDYNTGLGFDMQAPVEVAITNDKGVSVVMYVYRSTNKLTSETIIQVL
jgi:hypothetical protein